MKFTKDNIKKIERFIEIKNRGYYANGTELQAVYNEVFEVNKPATNCGSCIRQRIQELENVLRAFKRNGEMSGFTDVYQYIDEINAIESEIKPSESVSTPEPIVMKVEENKAVREPKNKPVIKKAGRPKKK